MRTEQILNKLDLVQGITSYNTKKADLMAVEWAKLHNKGIIGGSDGHTIDELGRAVTCANGRDVNEFFQNISHKLSLSVGEQSSNINKLLLTLKKEIPIIRDCIRNGTEYERIKHQLSSMCKFRQRKFKF